MLNKRKLINLPGLLILSALFMAPQLEAREAMQLTEHSFNNNVVMEVSDGKNHSKGIRLRLKAINRGEPAATPIYIDLSIRCAGDKKSQKVDIPKLIAQAGGQAFDHYQDLFSGLDTKTPGELRVCAFESLNFDESLIKLSVLKPGDGGCDQRKTVDFLVPIKDYCAR